MWIVTEDNGYDEVIYADFHKTKEEAIQYIDSRKKTLASSNMLKDTLLELWNAKEEKIEKKEYLIIWTNKNGGLRPDHSIDTYEACKKHLDKFIKDYSGSYIVKVNHCTEACDK